MRLNLMNNISAWLLVLPLMVATAATAQVDFNHSQDFEAMQANARQEGKYLFIDAYTDWCGPCKQMAATTFQDPEVGEFFNENFVNLKIEMVVYLLILLSVG